MKEQLPFDNDDLEKLLREKSDEFLLYPNRKVWHGIYNNVHPGKKWPSISISILLLASLYLIGYLNTNQKASSANISTANTTIQKEVKPAVLSENLIADVTPVNNDAVHQTTAFHSPTTKKMLSGVTTVVASGNKVFHNRQTETPLNQSKQVKIYAATIQNRSRANTTEPSSTAALTDASNSSEYTDGNSPDLPANPAKNHKNQLNGTINTLLSSSTPVEVRTSGQSTTSEEAMQFDIKRSEPQALKNQKESAIPAALALAVGSNPTSPSTVQQTAVAGNQNKTNNEASENTLSLNEKIWMEHDIMYNRAIPKKWKGKLEKEWYFTPSVTIGHLTEKSRDITLDAQASLYAESIPSLNQAVSKSPSLGAEIGFGLRYALHPKLRLKGAIQLNFTQYSINAYDNAHPSATSITLLDSRSALPYEIFKSTNYSNLAGIHPVKLHNNSFQFSLPVGADYRIWTNGKLNWYAGLTLQPSIVLIGHNYLLSSDKRSFIYDNSLQNRFNLHAGFETFISYERNGYTWQIGPRFRSQLFTTNTRLYPIEEKIQNIGIKIGLSKRL